VSIESVAQALREKFSGAIAEGNVAAAREAYDFVQREIQEASHAKAD
jgi:pyruvate ferredoxin oxidoreductase gamma subunit